MYEKTAGVNEFPLIASLIDGQTATLFCGATIIGRHHALTAARCLTDVNPFQIALLVGDHDMTSISKSKKTCTTLLSAGFAGGINKRVMGK